MEDILQLSDKIIVYCGNVFIHDTNGSEISYEELALDLSFWRRGELQLEIHSVKNSFDSTSTIDLDGDIECAEQLQCISLNIELGWDAELAGQNSANLASAKGFGNLRDEHTNIVRKIGSVEILGHDVGEVEISGVCVCSFET